MRKLFLPIYFGLMVVALSCTEDVADPVALMQEQGMMELTIRTATDGRTKVGDTSLEEGVKSLQVFIFSDDGKLESVGSSGSNSVTLRCFRGDKDIYAVANLSEEIVWTSEMTVSDLMETFFELDGGLNIMFGDTNVSLDEFPSTSSVVVDMTVKRVAARFVLRNVTNSSTDSGGGTVNVLRAYLINVVNYAELGDLYSGSPPNSYSDPDGWSNKEKYAGELDNLLYSGELGMDVGVGKTVAIDQYFYCYPNLTAQDSDTLYGGKGTWTPRFTRLVMEAEYNGTRWYYVVSINGVRSNCSYEVTYEIFGPGSSNPEEIGNVVDGTSGYDNVDSGGNEDDDRRKNPGDDEEPDPTSLTLDERDIDIHFIGGRAKVKECVL